MYFPMNNLASDFCDGPACGHLGRTGLEGEMPRVAERQKEAGDDRLSPEVLERPRAEALRLIVGTR
jgi:hypothetical protein